MPSVFEQEFAGQLDQLYGEFGVTATYTAPNGVNQAVTVRIQRHEARQVEGMGQRGAGAGGATGELQTGEAFVRQSELAKPVKGGRFTLEAGAEVWTIETTPLLKNGQHYCIVSRGGVDRYAERRAKA